MPAFRIIYCNYHEHKELPYDRWSEYTDTVYSDFQSAKKEAKRLEAVDTPLRGDYNYATGQYATPTPYYKYLPYKVPENEDYVSRETARIEAKEYEPLPRNMWLYPPADGYDETYGNYVYPRLTEDKKMIAYYASNRDARYETLTTVKPTKYFSRYFNSEQTWDFMAELGLISGEFTLAFATTREDIRFVYENGPESCMSGEAERYWSGSVHPTEAYASPDLELAYMYHGNDPKAEDVIVARALCNAKTKEWVRIYGDICRMQKLLEEKGYSENIFCLGGCRLLKIFAPDRHEEDQIRNNIVMLPYLDGRCQEVEFTAADEYLKIIPRKIRLSASTQTGYQEF